MRDWRSFSTLDLAEIFKQHTEALGKDKDRFLKELSLLIKEYKEATELKTKNLIALSIKNMVSTIIVGHNMKANTIIQGMMDIVKSQASRSSFDFWWAKREAEKRAAQAAREMRNDPLGFFYEDEIREKAERIAEQTFNEILYQLEQQKQRDLKRAESIIMRLNESLGLLEKPSELIKALEPIVMSMLGESPTKGLEKPSKNQRRALKGKGDD